MIIYQTLVRHFGNQCLRNKQGGTILDNGVGKMNDFDDASLRRIHEIGVTHMWYTGVIRHATCTDYTAYGIPAQHPAVVKGEAGSPYAIADYYDIDPDLACDVKGRMTEFEALVSRTHDNGMKVIIDFVPNHVARQYHSIAKPDGVEDLGASDDMGKHFDASNNFYYCPGEAFTPSVPLSKDGGTPYREFPAKATGNDCFNSHPGVNDWYETVKLNYGVDYCDAGGRSFHFTPMPDTWCKMKEILMFWASKGVDGFRCDMAEMVPSEFWSYATGEIKKLYPEVIFIGEVYNPWLYRTYITSGFDYLYDKVGMYDCLKDVICGRRPASSITSQWQAVDDIKEHMLYFLENHDEQRIASSFFCGSATRALPGVAVAALLQSNPFMIYSGQEYGECGMDSEGFSGCDGRTTIFDYWTVSSIYKGYHRTSLLTEQEKQLCDFYKSVMTAANSEKAVREGDFFDLMYVNLDTQYFNSEKAYTFMRYKDDDVILVVANFSDDKLCGGVNVPKHAFELFGMDDDSTMKRSVTDILTNETHDAVFASDRKFDIDVAPWGVRIYKISFHMNDMSYTFNAHDKDEFPPAHTAEHLLNQLMGRMFGCERSSNAHIERKKSKISYVIDHKPSRMEEKEIEMRMNELIEEDLPVSFEVVSRDNLPEGVDASRLPSDASDSVRLVRIGDYDVCPCIGKHVRSTSQIGKFVMLGTNWDEMTHTFRIRYKVV